MLDFLGAAIGAIGSVIGSSMSQPQFMTPAQSIKSTVKGARAVGIHPLAALGSTAAQYTPLGNNPMGAGIASGAQQIGAALSNTPAVRSEIDVNRAQADLIRAQTSRILNETRAVTTGGTTGAQNVSDPTKPPDIRGAVGQRIAQAFGDVSSVAAPPQFKVQQTPAGPTFVPVDPLGIDEEITRAFKGGTAITETTGGIAKNFRHWKMSNIRSTIERAKKVLADPKASESRKRTMRKILKDETERLKRMME